MDESLAGGIFGETFSAADQPSEGLKHTHSMPGPLSALDKKPRVLSPLGRTYSGALKACLPTEIMSFHVLFSFSLRKFVTKVSHTAWSYLMRCMLTR